MSAYSLSHNRYLGRDFCDKYEASIIPSYRRYRRVRQATLADIQQWYATTSAAMCTKTDPSDHQIQEVEMVDITMPADRVADLLESQENSLYRRVLEEQRLREEYPALKSAWEQYQIVLAMVK